MPDQFLLNDSTYEVKRVASSEFHAMLFRKAVAISTDGREQEKCSRRLAKQLSSSVVILRVLKTLSA